MKMLLASLFLLFSVAFAAVSYPQYLQCDPKWGNDMMGIPGKPGNVNICRGGCAMSSVAMALAGYNISINGQIATPGTLNAWLIQNNGYHCISDICWNLALDAPDRISPKRVRSLGEPPAPFLRGLVKIVRSGLIVIAHVQNQHHFVLVTGFQEPNKFLVNDPFFPKTYYTYDEIHDFLFYDIQ